MRPFRAGPFGENVVTLTVRLAGVHIVPADPKVGKVLGFSATRDCCATATLSFQRLAKRP